MHSILADFPSLKQGDYLYILPIERLFIEEKFKFKNIFIYPSGYINVKGLFNSHFFLDKSLGDIKKLETNTLIAFIGDSPVKFPGQATNNFYILDYALDYLTPILDYIVFHYCNINNNKTLPARIGQINTGETLLLLFNGVGSPFTRIISEKINVNTITLGKGLTINNLNMLNSFPLLNNDISEAGNIGKYALRMFAQMLESNSYTEKFIQIIRLFEFIASPDKYEKFKSVKAKIIAHVANNIHLSTSLF